MERVAQLRVERHVLRPVEAHPAEGPLDARGARLGEGDVVGVLVGVVVAAGDEAAHEGGQPLRAGEGVARLPGDDEGDAGLVDEDGVGLVHEGEVVLALHAVARLEDEAVAQVVEAGLLRGEVGDVARVGPTAVAGAHALLDEADAEAEP
ncbi:MAG TPA: hypothetical protein VLL75_12315, partial [Vicinamibacteria bacterium]|nr:hypothetical protein [Vicinamibacteria bacterium]